MKALKANKANLSKQRSHQKELLRECREARNQIASIQSNVKAILGDQTSLAKEQSLL